MKTPRNDSHVAGRTNSTTSATSRRQRTLAAFACESLEGRKLMTGFAGASAAMDMPRFAEMGDMNGGGRHDWGMPRSGQSDSAAAATTDATGSAQDSSTTANVPDSASTPGAMKSFRMQADDNGDGGDFGGDRGGRGLGRDLDMGRDEARGMGMGEGFGMDDGMGHDDIPMANQTQDGDNGQTSTGDTQLDTDIQKLQTDEQAIQDKSEVTPKLLAAVRNDLQAIDKAKTGTADATALKTLQTDEQTIFSSQTAPTDAQQTQIQADRDAVLKSQGVSQTLIDQLAADRLAVKTASHFTADDQTLLDADHQAIEKDRTAAQTTDASATTPTTTATPTTATPTSTTTAAASTSATPDTAAAAATPDTATPDAPAATPTPAPATPAASDPTSTPTTTAAPAPLTATTTATPTDPTATQTTIAAASGTDMHRGMHSFMGREGRSMGHEATSMGHEASFMSHEGRGVRSMEEFGGSGAGGDGERHSHREM